MAALTKPSGIVTGPGGWAKGHLSPLTDKPITYALPSSFKPTFKAANKILPYNIRQTFQLPLTVTFLCNAPLSKKTFFNNFNSISFSWVLKSPPVTSEMQRKPLRPE